MLQITSDDPASPAAVAVSGDSPPPCLVASLANAGNFGDTCLGSFHDEMLTLSNSGHCPLTIQAITSSSPDFLIPGTFSFPIVIEPGGDIELTLRFQPSHFGPSNATITIMSDDPASPLMLTVSGNTPSGTLTITGTTDFGGVLLGDRALQTLSICNTGHCDLHVTKVAFLPPCPCDAHKRKPCGCGAPCNCGCGCGDHHEHGEHGDHNGHGEHHDGGQEHDEHHGHHGHHHLHRCDQCCLNFRIVTNPFPATLRPGSCLSVLIEYLPTCDSAACCELLIESDDPAHPARKLFVTGHLRRTLRSALKCWVAQELHEILQALQLLIWFVLWSGSSCARAGHPGL